MPSPPKIRDQGDPPESGTVQQAFQIARYAHSSAASLLAGFDSLGRARGGGAPSHEQQDLLRAMLMFAGAGLDACAQQIVRDALPEIVKSHEAAREALQGFAARRLRKVSATGVTAIDENVLAKVLLGDAEEVFIELLIDDLTGSSMQSVEELKRVAAHLGVISSTELAEAIETVRAPLKVRNRIAHDMDIKFTESTSRNRRGRKRADMVRDTNHLLRCAEVLIVKVDDELT